MNDGLQMRQQSTEGNIETIISVYIYEHSNFSGQSVPGHHHPLNKTFCTQMFEMHFI